MSENNEEKLSERLDEALDLLEEKQPSAKQNPSAPRQSPTKQAKDKPVSPIGGLLGIFLALVAIGIATYGSYTVFELKKVIESSEPTPLEQSPATSKALADLRTSIEALKTGENLSQQTIGQIEAQQALSFSAMKTELENTLGGFKQSLGSSSEDWLLAEAEYLIRVANQRIKMEQDTVGALALLSSADEIIQAAEGVIAFDLRKSLAEDIAALKVVGDLDTDGIFVKLGALINQVNTLEQKNLQFTPIQVETDRVEAQSTIGKIMVLLKSAGSRLASLVDYRNDGLMITPILPPSEDYYLRQNLVMKMQHAQLALLRRKQSIFDSSLSDSLTWIEQYFDPEHGVTLAMVETIQSLQKIQIERAVPDISTSLIEMRKLMDGFDQKQASQVIDSGEEK